MKDQHSTEESICQKRRRLEDYLDTKKLYDDLNEIVSKREQERHFDRLMKEIAC